MSENKPALVSVVIPIFNKQQYLEKCLNSVFGQSYPEIEVIVVDDCSTDASAVKLNRLIMSHPECRIVTNRRNEGQLQSRYTGLAHAQGKYTVFVDADDWMEPNSISRMVEMMESLDVDMVQMRHQRRMKGISVKYQERFDPALAGRRIEDEEFRALASYVGMTSYIHPPCWGKLYITSKLREAPRMEFNQFWGEDQIFNIQYLRECKSMAFLDYVGYNYRWGGETSSTYKYSALKEYKHVHDLKRMLGQDEAALNEEIMMLLRYYIRSLVSEIGFTREAVVMIMEDELKDPMWRNLDPDITAEGIVAQEIEHVQKNPLKYLAKRLLK